MQMDILIRNGIVLTMDDSKGVIPCGYVAISGDRIVAVGEGEPDARAGRVIDADRCVVMPGLVNTHTHMTMMRGVCEDKLLMDWLEQICFPIDASLTVEDVRASALMCQAEMLLGGTTTFIDIYRYPGAVAGVAERTGIRAVIAPQIIDHPAGAGETFASNKRFVDEWLGRCPGRVIPWFGVHAPYSCDWQTYRDCHDAAAAYGIGIHTHLAETKSEIEQVREECGCSPFERLADIGAISGRMLAAHCVHVCDRDMDIMAESGMKVSYNPSSNMKLASGVAPITQMLVRGITVGLGTDSNLSNNNVDMFEEMRVAAMLQKLATGDARALPAGAVVRMATIEGARCLGLEKEIGSLEVGKKADLIVIDMGKPHLWPIFTGGGMPENVIAHLVYSVSAADVRTTIVDGRILVDEKQLVDCDLRALFEYVQNAAEDLYSRAREQMTQ
ncbi:MAG: amidohydrolase family protein [Bacteroidota bacterium]